MNQSIRPLPFALPSENAAAEGASLLPSFGAAEEPSSAEFDDLLDSELAEQKPDQKKPDEEEAWTKYGYAVTPLQILEAMPIQVTSVEAGTSEGKLSEGDLSLFNGSGEQSLEVAAEASDSNPEGDGANAEQSTDPAGRTLLEIVRPVQQKVPLNTPLLVSSAEQIAGNTPQPAKKGSGIPAAQSPPMLLTSQKQEETATKQKSAVLEPVFAVEAAEAKVEFRTGNSSRESSTKRDPELAEFSTVDSITPEWSSFDGILDTAEIQAPKDVESLEVVQAIRTHVELLRTSGQGKLDVVLRPDSQTQLHLQVERVNGQILVQARCERGDFLRLEANWSAVQQSLANQGVRVEALQQSPNLQQHQSFNGSFSSAEQHSSPRQEKETKFFERELSVPNHPKKPAASGITARGWQSWA